jgi:hypothetical protein
MKGNYARTLHNIHTYRNFVTCMARLLLTKSYKMACETPLRNVMTTRSYSEHVHSLLPA